MDMKIKIYFNNKEHIVNFSEKIKLSDAIINSGTAFNMDCGGLGVCGKCAVKAFGNLSEASGEELKVLGDKFKRGYRLACMTYAQGDCNVIIENNESVTGVTEHRYIEAAEPITGYKSCWASVIDIGTTTIAAYLYKMPEGELKEAKLSLNPQRAVGADVMSRISYAEKNGTEDLYRLINNEINNIKNEFFEKPDFTVVTGNTAMLSFYLNKSVHELGVFPFEASELFGYIDNEICVPKCISAFIGADITCGIMASGMLSNDRAMLIDIGTNGEIVYKNGNEIICCSAAAGPAFEGAGITNGCASVKGAISKVYNVGSSFFYNTIDSGKPCGICGSGIIDAVASMLKADIIDSTGYSESDFYIGDSGIFITPSDIRAVQTAKAAIRGAIETVCDDLNGVEKFYISGGFGKYLDINNAVLIGLLPPWVKGRTVLSGNTAAAGAAMILCDKRKFTQADKIAGKAKTIQLGANNTFYKNYIKYINF